MFQYMFHLHGEHNANSYKQNATVKLLFIGSLVCSSFFIDNDYMSNILLHTF